METKKLVYGVGINDADYVTQKMETTGYVNGKQKRKLVWYCPYYRAWMNMLERCYSSKLQESSPTYKGCSVSEEWLTFSVFTIDRGNDRGEWLIGVDWHKGAGKFRSQCRNPFTKKQEHIGCFTCQEEAHQAWINRKRELAQLLASIQTNSRVAEALINRYSNYKQ